MLNWAQAFNVFAFFDNQQYAIMPRQFECLLAVGCTSSISAADATLEQVNAFLAQKAWCFGHLSYSLSHELHGVGIPKHDPVGFPHFFFFVPEIVLTIRHNRLTIFAPDPDAVYAQVQQAEDKLPAQQGAPLHLRHRLTRDAYVKIIKQLQQHILRGDCYEINFCQEIFAEPATINPLSVYRQLSVASPAPFSAFYRLHNQYLLSASPERYITKKGTTVLSQPMKGTARRNLQDAAKDGEVKEALYRSTKERAENVMVVDLVRNDLSRICKKGTVKVDELFGVYSFPQVHQMISTISGQLKDEALFSNIIKATFPMGSMTGAPKQRVLELIDAYEPSARGIFSGSVGYITPEGDFDFNVVIRSIMYNAGSQYLSYQVGSGITFYSEAEKEWEECLLKGEAIKKVLTQRTAP